MITRRCLGVTLYVHCLSCFESDATSLDICVPKLQGKIMPPVLGWKGPQDKHKVTRRYIPEDGKLPSLCCDSIKYHLLTVSHLPYLTSSDSISLVSRLSSIPTVVALRISETTVRSFSQAICCAT